VVATARDAGTLTPLAEAYGDLVLPLSLDVTDKAAIDAAVKRAHEHFGRLDVVVNNAGYGLFGTIEEVSEEQARAQLETNLFGALWVTKAALPILREQGSGHIIQVSSIGGVNAFPGIGLYHASKWALEGFTQSLAAEVRGFGIHVTLIEPAGFSTDWRGPSAVVADQMPEYQPVRDYRAGRGNDDDELFDPGDPEATGPVVLDLVDAEEPPLRLFLGTGTLNMIKQEYAKRIAEWEQWDHLAVAAQGGVRA
jgi:NAD(P)-dependent dehydrogenase (short-subunit alcohol dehydrogenase family)